MVAGHWLQHQWRQARPGLGGSSCALRFLLSPNSLVVGFESRLKLTLNQDKATLTSAAACGGRRRSPTKSTNGHWTSCGVCHWATSGEYRGEGPRSWLWRACPMICDLKWWSKDKLLYAKFYTIKWGFPGGAVVKNLPSNEGDAGLIPGSEIAPTGGNGNPFQYSCLEKPMDRGAQQAIVHGAQSRTRLSNWTHTRLPQRSTGKLIISPLNRLVCIILFY